MDRPDKTNVVMAFSDEQAARLTGLSVNRLRAWDKSGFFLPSFASENRRQRYSRIYSFKDLVSLKTLGILINNHRIGTRYLRQVKESLSRGQEIWADARIYVGGNRVYLVEQGERVEPHTGQMPLTHFPLDEIVKELERDVQEHKKRNPEKVGQVSQLRAGSEAHRYFAGTRISLNTVKAYAADGLSPEEIVKEYPSLDVEEVCRVLENEKKGAA